MRFAHWAIRCGEVRGQRGGGRWGLEPRSHGVWHPVGTCPGVVEVHATELLNRQHRNTVVELSTAMADHIDAFYNLARRHSSLNYLTRSEYEALHSTKTQAAFS